MCVQGRSACMPWGFYFCPAPIHIIPLEFCRQCRPCEGWSHTTLPGTSAQHTLARLCTIAHIACIWMLTLCSDCTQQVHLLGRFTLAHTQTTP